MSQKCIRKAVQKSWAKIFKRATSVKFNCTQIRIIILENVKHFHYNLPFWFIATKGFSTNSSFDRTPS